MMKNNRINGSSELKRVLIANRGEIAVRLINSCKKLGITAIAIYTEEDVESMHVRLADESYALREKGSRGYLDTVEIVRLCVEHRIQGVIPGYGFLSEDAGFAEALEHVGILFIGPAPETLVQFGLKHRARELAIGADVPVVPGTEMLSDITLLEKEAIRIGFPIMVKATAGGGGMGLQVCHNIDELRAAIILVQSRGESLFKNSGLFLEKYVMNSRHIEAQIFGNGKGDVLFFGERECSIQRRHQKVLEESPSPFVLRHPDLRKRLQKASVLLAASVNYKSAGTVEFLVDDATGAFYFLEMNTRLQVEHGVSELCYGVDLVEMMITQAAEELKGNVGLSEAQLSAYRRTGPTGHAIEVRVYAENLAKGYSPAPGLLQNVEFPSGPGIRIDTWVNTGTFISPSFDPLLAKIMVHAADRPSAIKAMDKAISQTVLQGPPTNIAFLSQIVESESFISGDTTTNMLAERFTYKPIAVEFIDPGTYTTVQDYPGRLYIPNGVPVSGPMDHVSFQIANIIVGNDVGTEGFEITLNGPEILFYSAAVISLCGAPFSFTIDGNVSPLWTRHIVSAGSRIKIGDSSTGARAYLAIRGGLPSVAKYLGSKSTTPALNWGGYQGRCIRAGDFLAISPIDPHEAGSIPPYSVPVQCIPKFESNPTVYALPGPYYSSDFLSTDGQQHVFSTSYTISSNSNRGGIRLDGSPPTWARETGGEGGSHPSNCVGYGYPMGGVSFTGDTGILFAVDGPNQSGYLCTHTVIRSDLWRVGQLRPGDTLRFTAVTWKQAMVMEKRIDTFLQEVKTHTTLFADEISCALSPLDLVLSEENVGDGILCDCPADPLSEDNPRFVIRQSGDRGLLCEYGNQVFDVNLRARVQHIGDSIAKNPPLGFQHTSNPENCSIAVFFDPHLIDQPTAVQTIMALAASLSSPRKAMIPSRIIHLPVLFDADECQAAVRRYMTMQRPYASYLPDNVDFIRRSNGFETKAELMACYVETPHLVNAVGAMMGLPIYIQVDPRKRLSVPKYNPSRTFTPAGALGTGGTSSSIYPNDSPGGYMLWGLTLPGCPWDTWGLKPGFTPEKPWLFEPFDQIIFHSVDRPTYDAAAKAFRSGLYEIKIEQSVFDMGTYNKLIESTKEEVRINQEIQEECTRVEIKRETELYAQWVNEMKEAELKKPNKKFGKDHENCIKIVARTIASVWQIKVSTGDVVEAGTVVAILEAMKMEINVQAPSTAAEYTVAAVMVERGDRVEVGDILVLLDRKES